MLDWRDGRRVPRHDPDLAKPFDRRRGRAMMLDNPIWGSLTTCHRGIAIGSGPVRRYPPVVTPFGAVEQKGASCDEELKSIVPIGERIGFLSVIPTLGPAWQVINTIEVRQYVWPDGLTIDPSPTVVDLGEEDIPAMIELTTLVYPAYFRPETARLGPYKGIRHEGRLCAMAGIRMAMTGYQELSAICTHPDWRSRGYASLLTESLIERVLAQGDTPFLHTEEDNHSAQSIYERVGLVHRATLPFTLFERNT